MVVHFSILCLTALNKIDEAGTLVNQLIEQYPQNADLLIIRARLSYKEKSKVSQYARLSYDDEINCSFFSMVFSII